MLLVMWMQSHDTTKKVELLELYHRLISAAGIAHHFKINESSMRIIVKKKIKKKKVSEAVTAGISQAQKPCTFNKIPFYLMLEMKLLYGCNIATRSTYL